MTNSFFRQALFDMFQPGDKLLVAVSGGVDSIVLLYALNQLRFHRGLHLTVVHINHRNRKGNEKDAAFVKDLCAQWDIPCRVHAIKVPPLKDQSSWEERARRKRHAVYRRLVTQLDLRGVVLGHHKNDQAETVLLHLLRGTGLQGLRGMRPATQMDGLTIFRPLLSLTKAAIRTWAQERGLKAREDPTNRDPRYLRNKIRTELIPILEGGYQPQIVNRLADLAQQMQDDYELIREIAEKQLKQIQRPSRGSQRIHLDLVELKNLNSSLRRWVLRLAVTSGLGHGRRLTARHFEAIEQILFKPQKNLQLTLPQKVTIQITNRLLIIQFP